ncbi:hypothetical protein FOZ61_002714 [Perkinsus olseni]|uniref:Uncharacterized protein n=2 Tax=Perkinsus olseni TaxID=32597 RepID=A0A7J6KP88_PEROL|nr:hypothetical protein FOZ61_002714 [Perkinsus olseni]
MRSMNDGMLTPVDPLSEAEPECQLFPGYFGYFVQLALFTICALSLVLKKYKEGSGVRTWWEFLLDSSKQGLGSAWIHCLNLIFATKLHEETGGDPCDWYWINIMVDVLIGTGINYILLKLITEHIIPLLFGDNIARGFISGDYGNSVHHGRQWQTKGTNWGNYLKQLVIEIDICDDSNTSGNEYNAVLDN